MKPEVEVCIKELEQLKERIHLLEISALYEQMKSSSIKSFKFSCESEYNDEGGSYLVFRLDKLNGKELEESLYEYFFEDSDVSQVDWFCSFCLENELKQAEIEEFMAIFYNYLSESTKESLSNDSVTLSALKKQLDKLKKVKK